MAILFHAPSQTRVALAARSLIGRSPGCVVYIRSSVVSGEHASVRWNNGSWWIRDLASRNGTWVAGQSLAAGQEVRLVQGSQLAFGAQADGWILEDAGPPGAVAVCLDEPLIRRAEGGVLLPDSDAPQTALYGGVDGHWLQDNGSDVPMQDGTIVPVQGKRWRLHLPRNVEPTIEARVRPVQIRFRVSMDEEYVEIDVETGDTQTRLRPRSFNYLLLTLARQRLSDAELPTSSRGWLDQSTLAEQLRLEPRTINVQLYRARQAFGAVRLDIATLLVERRNRTGQLRFGLDSVDVQRI